MDKEAKQLVLFVLVWALIYWLLSNAPEGESLLPQYEDYFGPDIY